MKLGVITDCFKLPLEESFKKAGELGFNGVQVYATTGSFSPEVLGAADRAKYKKLLKDCGLEVSALCGDMGGHGFQIACDNPARIEATKRIVDLANDFETKVVTTHIGVIPDDKLDPTYGVMAEALSKCGRYAVEKGVTLAIETGPESAKTLLGFVEDAGAGVGVNLDPANFVMVTAQDPVEAVKLLGKHIVHTHAKDGRMLKKTDPKIIYEHFATGGIEALNVADYFIELPLGEGDVAFDAYVAALRSVGFDGYLTVERETGADPARDIIKARDFLKKYL
ncbi:MAG: sugar phosphate isomerase/epimerase [Ruminococcaceae bacterium]|nr:sugar phosphate isomerase/epimerase [Oscillospiraceae bacterium]